MTGNTPIDTVLHVSDLHFWQVVLNPFRLLNKRFLGNMNVVLRRQYEFATHRAEAYADAIMAVGIPRILFTGDLTSTSLEGEFALAARFVERLVRRGAQVWVLPGNHDVYTFKAHRKRTFERHFAPFMPHGGYPSKERLPGGTPLVLVPTAVPNLISSRGLVSPQDVAAIESTLQGEGPALIAAHYPVLTRTRAYLMTWEHGLRGAGALRAALGRTGRRLLYVCGHVHRFNYERDAQYPLLEHLSTGALFQNSPTKKRLGEFSEIHVLADGFAVFRHQYEDGWVRRAVTVQNPSKR